MSFITESEFSQSEVMYYLEEVIAMDSEDEIESETYYNLKEIGKTSRSNYYYVIEKMTQLYKEKF